MGKPQKILTLYVNFIVNNTREPSAWHYGGSIVANVLEQHPDHVANEHHQQQCAKYHAHSRRLCHPFELVLVLSYSVHTLLHISTHMSTSRKLLLAKNLQREAISSIASLSARFKEF